MAAKSKPEPAPRRGSLPGALHLGCGDDYHEDALNVDVNPESAADECLDVTETPWPYPDGSFSRVEAHHLVEHIDDRAAFFHEAARVLSPGGVLVVTTPLGVNAATDDDHEPPHWTYETPTQYSRSHRRAWDPDVPLRLEDRRVNVWLGGPLAAATPLFQAAAVVWPAWTAQRCYGGELTAHYRRLTDED